MPATMGSLDPFSKEFYAKGRRRKVAARKKVKGFKNNQKEIAKREGISEKRAGAILASATRNASPEAKRRNPALNRVKGASHKKKGKGGK